MHPEVILVSGIFLVPIAALVVVYLTRRLQSEERMKAIEKGVPIPFEPVEPRERAARTRRWAIVLVALGLGVIVVSVATVAVEHDRDGFILAGFAAIPILIGLGLLVDYRLRMKEIAAEEARRANRAPVP